VPVASDSGAAPARRFIPRFPFKDLALSPDGNRLVYIAVEGNRGVLYERRLDRDTEVRLSPPDTGDYVMPFFSPDGAWLGFCVEVGDHTQLRRMSLADRSIQTIGSVDSLSDISGFAWGDDGTIVAASEDTLYRIPASGGSWAVLAGAHPAPGEAIQWFQPEILPGSMIVLFHAARSYDPKLSDIVALDIASGRQWTVLRNAMNPIYARAGYLLFVREGTLMGVAFDPRHAVARGQPVVLIGDVMQSLYGSNTGQETGAAQVALSASGDLAYTPGGVGQPVLARVVRVTSRGDTIPVAMEPHDWILLRLSPDGTRLAAVSRRGQAQQIWIHDLARGTSRRLDTGGYVNWPLAWSPDGRSIVFSSDRDHPGRPGLFRMPADGSGTPQRIAPSDHGQLVADWSSQGVIAYLQDDDIWIIPPDSAPRPFFTSPATEAWPAFSPDGRWLAYASDASGRFEVYVRPYPGGEPATLVSTAGGVQPMWSRDGRTLFYDVRDTLMAVDLAPGPAFRPGRVRPYLAPLHMHFGPVRAHDVFPDGSIVILATDPHAPVQPRGSNEIRVILDFAAELQARVRQ
ncbi:MAG TPA: hypothetical protein VNL37_07455, partial [Candidatus Polarisedimenticolia bacterium]|nr:hypothetical protein [Candidatus Polarisedimenticolia bacterium]